jgi:AcrR family transcriptional regulator
MRAKSELVAGSQRRAARAESPKGKRRPTARMPAAERRAQILEKAFEFFAEYGFTAQTRALAEACGVSQRLLYSAFPNKAELINAMYEAGIAGPFKAVWLEQLRDRGRPVRDRLEDFYREYYAGVLTRRWLRLFLYASLAEVELAPTYIAAIVRTLLETIVAEAAHEAKRKLPAEPAVVQELGWTLHGAVSHLAIRRHIYRNATNLEVEKVVSMHVRVFLAGVREILSPLA